MIRRVELYETCHYECWMKNSEGDHVLMSLEDARLLVTGDCNYPKVFQELRCAVGGYSPEQPE